MAKNIFDDFYCTSCGKKGIPIVRKAGAGRESGHLKKLSFAKEKQTMLNVNRFHITIMKIFYVNLKMEILQKMVRER